LEEEQGVVWGFLLKITTSERWGGGWNEKLRNGFVEVFSENQTEKKSIN